MKPHGDNFLGTRRGSSVARGVTVCFHKNSISEDEMHFSHREEQTVNADAKNSDPFRGMVLP